MFRACFVSGCVAGQWSRDPASTIAAMFFVCVLRLCVMTVNAKANVKANASESMNADANVPIERSSFMDYACVEVLNVFNVGPELSCVCAYFAGACIA